MKNFFFSIPDRESHIFRCEVKEDDLVLYTREVHVYDSSFSDEMNVAILAKKMAETLGEDEESLTIPIRLAVIYGYSTLTLPETELQ